MSSQETFIRCRDAYLASNSNDRISAEINMVNAYRELIKGTAQGRLVNRLIKQGIWKSPQATEFVKMIAGYKVPTER